MKPYKPLVALLMLVAIIIACKKDQASTDDTAGGTISRDNIPAVYKKIYGATDMYIQGDYLVIKTTGLPDHKTPYYTGTAWATAKYEAYNGTNTAFILNPNRIAEADATFKIPLNPKVASTHAATPLGAMGVALNGVDIFNQYAAMYSPLTNEANSFDQYGGHPQQQGVYHYHVEPTYLTTAKGKDALMGFLLDGFPVYGPLESGKTITNADLDVYHGHTSVTADYPAGIYHYHITAADPYINGNGYYGTPGTVSQ
ncbi:MAG: YHYH protein [Bacteroidota bacterium]